MSSMDNQYFSAATVYARKIDHKGDRIMNFMGAHRCQWAKLDTGYLIIDKPWYFKGSSNSPNR